MLLALAALMVAGPGGSLLPSSFGAQASGTLEGQVLSAKGKPMSEAVVYVDGPREGTPPAKHPVLDQRHRAFIPRVMAVLQGTTVDFPNHDSIFHNVFSVREGKRFDLGLYPAGTRREVHFDRPGLVRIFCSIHSEMSAFIWVLRNPYFAVTGPDGRFHIEGVPSGTQKVVAWHEPSLSTSRSVTVPEREAAPLRLVLPAR